MGNFVISPKFCRGFFLISKQIFLPDLKSNSHEFGFIGLLVQSAFMDILFINFHQGLTFNLSFNQLMFKINPNLTIDLRGLLL